MDQVKAVGINHVALEVGDLEEALKFYGALFQLKLRGRKEKMAFIDLGDQFIALNEGRTQSSDSARHFGLVVDDREKLRAKVEELGAEIIDGGPGLDFLDPWGNHVQVVDYRSIQFTKTSAVLQEMGLSSLSKTPEALAELREKGMAP